MDRTNRFSREGISGSVKEVQRCSTSPSQLSPSSSSSPTSTARRDSQLHRKSKSERDADRSRLCYSPCGSRVEPSSPSPTRGGKCNLPVPDLRTSLGRREGWKVLLELLGVLSASFAGAFLWVPAVLTASVRAHYFKPYRRRKSLLVCYLIVPSMLYVIVPWVFYAAVVVGIGALAYSPIVCLWGLSLFYLCKGLERWPVISMLMLPCLFGIVVCVTALMAVCLTPLFFIIAAITATLGWIEAPLWYLLAPPFFFLMFLRGNMQAMIFQVCPVLQWVPTTHLLPAEDGYPSHPRLLKVIPQAGMSRPWLFVLGTAMTLHNECVLLFNRIGFNLLYNERYDM